jgi:predicted RNA-binding Zn ribbon-like protein
VAFEFIADHRVLDFLATLAERGTTDYEHLRAPADLAAWAAQSGVVDAPIDPSEAEFARAIALREALYRVLDAAIEGRAPRPADREFVNAAAGGRLPTRELTPGGDVRRSGDVQAVLAAVAVDALDLLGGPDRALLRHCADERCTRLFVDRSRGGRRRWCDMKGCGDRAKAAAYRRRRRAGEHAQTA